MCNVGVCRFSIQDLKISDLSLFHSLNRRPSTIVCCFYFCGDGKGIVLTMGRYLPMFN